MTNEPQRTSARRLNIAKIHKKNASRLASLSRSRKKLVGVVIGLFRDFKCACFIAFKARTFNGEVRSE